MSIKSVSWIANCNKNEASYFCSILISSSILAYPSKKLMAVGFDRENPIKPMIMPSVLMISSFYIYILIEKSEREGGYISSYLAEIKRQDPAI